MRFFTTSEASGIASDKIRPVRNSIEREINIMINNKNYGSGINIWGHIIVCNSPEFYKDDFLKEIKRYFKAKKELDLRLKVDYDSVEKAADKEIPKIIYESILRGVDIAKSELKIPDFDFETFRNDLTILFKQEKWI